jgi:glutamate-1-semialdehyde 2,1-aminomutase
MSTGTRRSRYLEADSRAATLFDTARNFLPGGNTRQSVWVSPRPPYAVAGSGCRVTDADGETRVDFVNNYTSLIHGHGDPRIAAAVSEQLVEGTAFGLPTPFEIDLAKLLCERVESIERVRFTNSGTEAVMMAVKAARAYTGRSKIAKFEGCYHGAYDPVEVSQAPTPDNWGPAEEPNRVPFYPGHPGLDDVVVLSFNDTDSSVRLLERYGGELAAVVIDPLPLRAGLIPAEENFLSALREVTRRLGILLIFDEVMSFRNHYGGAQALFGGEPDLTAIAKIIGGGFPVGAVGGRADVMEIFSPSASGPRLPHAGTFNGNPITMLAGLTAMQMMPPGEYERLHTITNDVRDGANALFDRIGADWQITGAGNMFRLHPNRRSIRNYREFYRSPEENERASNLYHGLMARGIMLTPDGMGNISTPMDSREVDQFLSALEDTLSEPGV